MSEQQMTEYRRKLGEFFYPFLGNVELGNISASENTKLLVDVFISFNEVGYFIHPYSEEDTETITRGKRMKLEELSIESQNAAREVLVNILIKDFSARGDLVESRAEYLARAVGKSFAALEGGARNMAAGSSSGLK